ncbi:elongation factor P hydroxylase [Microbulbifer sp. 2304DJ12-6]|uniref:elongation factor P hydroxylase n=1 Tax=Microbulbifer sp. 2304DJ12-6 TaxID=3233340 RepID=UPI0039B05FF6
MPVWNPEIAPVSTTQPMADRIALVFDRCFADPKGFNTRLCGGYFEPYYRPAGGSQRHHQVEFTRGYAASALHEAAHWCLAGEARRRLPDYGYWYLPDGRSAEQQAAFEEVEVRPQALEWVFARACGLRFRVSSDNLYSGLGPSDSFKVAIWARVREYCHKGANARARAFARALACEFGRPDPFSAGIYQLADLS